MKRVLALSVIAVAVSCLGVRLSAILYAQESSEPSKQHQELASEVGTWDAEISAWPTPESDPETFKGVEKNKMLGKLWLLSTFDGEMGGVKFTGHMQLGYDPGKKKYVGTWIDSLNPHLQLMEGDYDEATKTFTLMSTGIDIYSGKEKTTKNVTRYLDKDSKVFEMHMPVEGQQGKWWKMMEIKYTRRK
jgi:hypothetical protein